MQYIDIRLNGLKIRLESAVTVTFGEFRQGDHDSEACGVLLGMQWADRWVITEATEPQDTDRRAQTRYVRNVQGHAEIAQKRWRDSDGLIGYLGEWHTHPTRKGTPSQTDIREIAALSQRFASPLLSIVVGRDACTALLVGKGVLLASAGFALVPTHPDDHAQ